MPLVETTYLSLSSFTSQATKSSSSLIRRGLQKGTYWCQTLSHHLCPSWSLLEDTPPSLWPLTAFSPPSVSTPPSLQASAPRLLGRPAAPLPRLRSLRPAPPCSAAFRWQARSGVSFIRPLHPAGKPTRGPFQVSPATRFPFRFQGWREFEGIEGYTRTRSRCNFSSLSCHLRPDSRVLGPGLVALLRVGRVR